MAPVMAFLEGTVACSGLIQEPDHLAMNSSLLLTS